MSTKKVTLVPPTDAVQIVQAMAQACNVEIAAGRQVVAIEVDAETDALLAGWLAQYRGNSSGRAEILGLPVVVTGELGWRIRCRVG